MTAAMAEPFVLPRESATLSPPATAPARAPRADAPRAPAAPTIAAEVVDATAYLALEPLARALATRAAEPNVFADPRAVDAIARAAGAPLVVAIAWAGLPGAERVMVGAWPLLLARPSLERPLAALSGEPHPYMVLSTPLLDPAHADAALAEMLAALAARDDLPRALSLRFLSDQGVAMRALERSGARIAVLERYTRSRHDRRPGGAEAFWAARFPGRKRQKHRAERRKLDAKGPVLHSVHHGAQAIEAFEEFLALEAASWKGRAGTAVVCHPVDAAFMRHLVGGLAAHGLAEIHALRREGRALALGLVLRSGSGAWFHKIAHDESLSRLAPGVHLAHELTAALMDEAGIDMIDSCAHRDGSLLGPIYADAQPIADVLVEIGPRSVRFDLAVAATRLAFKARALAKAAWKRARAKR